MIGTGVHLYNIYLYIYMYMCDSKKSLNGTLAIDLPFKSLQVDFSLNL